MVVRRNGVRVKMTRAQIEAAARAQERAEADNDDLDESEQEEQLPFGGLIDGKDASTLKSQLLDSDRENFTNAVAAVAYAVSPRPFPSSLPFPPLTCILILSL